MPSRRRQTSWSAAALRSSTWKPGVHQMRPVREQLHGLAVAQRSNVLGTSEFQRSHGLHLLARNAQGLAAGDQHAQGVAAAQQRIDQRGDRLQQVLAVVEHEQQPRGAHALLEDLQHRRPRDFPDAQGVGDHGVHVPCVAHRGQIDEGDTIGEARLRFPGDLEREPGFAAAADADQGEQGAVAKVRHRLPLLALAPEEMRAEFRQRRGELTLCSPCDLCSLLGLCGGAAAGRDGDKTVPAGRNCGDRANPEESAQGADLDLEVVLLDDQAFPDLADQLVLGYYAVAMLQQHEQHIEGSRANRRRPAVDQHLSLCGATLDRSKAEASCIGTPDVPLVSSTRSLMRAARLRIG